MEPDLQPGCAVQWRRGFVGQVPDLPISGESACCVTPVHHGGEAPIESSIKRTACGCPGFPMHPMRFTSASLVIRVINTCVSTFSEVFSPRGVVLDIGSYYPPEYKTLCDRRPLFPDNEYIGCDLRRGHGVDRIEDAERLSFPSASAGVVLLLEILEHLKNPDRAISEARRVLREDGLLAISVPFSYRLHGFPTDYWRFTASGIHHLLESFPQKLVLALGPSAKPTVIFAVASNSQSADFTVARLRFNAAIQAASKRLRRQIFLSALQERGREFFGLIAGRANVSVLPYDPVEAGGYVFESLRKDS